VLHPDRLQRYQLFKDVGTKLHTLLHPSHPIEYCIQDRKWPGEYFEKDSPLRVYLQQKSSFEEVKNKDWFTQHFEEFKHKDWFEEEYGQMSSMSHLLNRLKPSPSLVRITSDRLFTLHTSFRFPCTSFRFAPSPTLSGRNAPMHLHLPCPAEV